MPDMNQLEIGGVVYDVRDPTKAPAEIADNKALALTTAIQENYTVDAIHAFSRAGVVDVHITVVVVEAATSWITIATLPSGCRPPVNVYEDVPFFRAADGNELLRLRITTGGAIQVRQGTPGAQYAFHDMFISA